MTRLEGKVEKGWGHEQIWVTNDKYCSKFLVFKKDKSFSMHFHANKLESWFVLKGSFNLELLNTKNATISTHYMTEGKGYTIHPLTPHRLTALEEGSTILEVSTPDSVEDNYRVLPGASQNVSN
jgi:mannose-6-phosphate isomerase-like protein (cupin superfamily)